MGDVETIIKQLLGAEAVNAKKTEGPAQVLTIIGWECNMHRYAIAPSMKGLKKMFYWVFKGARQLTRKFSMKLSDLRKMVGVLRWYSTVMPLASTFELQALLAEEERIASGKDRSYALLTNIRSNAAAELTHWRWLLAQGLQDPLIWSAPVWYLAQNYEDQDLCIIYTDASTTIGGGYMIEPRGEQQGRYGQFRWTEQEQQCYGVSVDHKTDINAMEFVTAAIAIITEREHLQGKVVRVHVDNTAAVAWLNKRRSSHVAGQGWMRLLIYTLLTYKIILLCDHIAGVNNIVADQLSRFIQDVIPHLESGGLQKSTPPDAEWRLAVWRRSTIDYSSLLKSLIPKEAMQRE
jgi:hypothetical protein